MPFAMIDLEWLDGSEYHRFLLWIVKNMSGSDGFGGLSTGQVRFSRREVERIFRIGPSHAGFLIQKAVLDGLLIPLGKHRKRKGMGEIYDTYGELRTCRIQGEPRSNQDRTKTEPTKPVETDALGEQPNQDRTKIEPRLNRLKDKTKKTKKEVLTPIVPLEEVVEIWNTTTTGLLPSAKPTPKRRKLLELVYGQPGWLDDFRAACGYCASTPFYRGENDRQWVATLDYLLRDGKASELAEKGRFKPRPNTRSSKTADVDADFISQLSSMGIN